MRFESVRISEQIKLFLTNSAIIIVTVCLMAVVCIVSAARDLANSRTFAVGIVVDGVDLSGMSYDDARTQLLAKASGDLSQTQLTLNYKGVEIVCSAYELGAITNVSEVLDEAIEYSSDSRSYDVRDSEGKSRTFSLSISVDKAKLESTLGRIAVEYDAECVDAKAVFDKETHEFSYVDGINGTSLDVARSGECVERMLIERTYETCVLPFKSVEPTITANMVRENTVLIGSHKSITTGNFNRNTNISLMCEYVNGYEILPNEVLSINDLVGERTSKKGFLSAPAIMDGKRIENDLGGGICQLSGTLYNAALWANLNVVERYPHSWPSDYVDIGLDSTLDWNTRKDLKIKNMSDYPVYIVTWLTSSDLNSQNELNVEIYGQPLPEGVTVDVRSEIIATYAPLADKTTYVSSLSPGERQTVITARTGYRTEVWRTFYYDGKMIDRELVSTSYYAPIQGEVYIGRSSVDGNRPPRTPTPTITPTPAPSDTFEPIPIVTWSPHN